jgi:hypothetical protein
MDRRHIVIPALSAAAVVVIAVGAGIVATDHGDSPPAARRHVGSPTLPALATDAGNRADTAAAAVAPERAGKIAAPAPGSGAQTVTIKNPLPAATDALVPAYRLARHEPSKDELLRLAKALGVSGTPQAQGSGWLLGDHDSYVSIDPTPTLDWRFQPGDIACAEGIGAASSGVGATVAGGGSAVSEIAPDKPLSDEPAPNKPSSYQPPPASDGAAVAPAPGPCAGGTVSSGVACAAPDGAETLVACPTPEAKPVATEDAARAAVLSKLGVHADAGDARVDEGYDGVRHVSVSRSVAGRAVVGMTFEIGVDAAGTVVAASGQLAEPVLAGEYPMLPPAELAQSLANTRVRMMMCVQQPGVDGCAPPPPIVVTGASVGLSLTMPSRPRSLRSLASTAASRSRRRLRSAVATARAAASSRCRRSRQARPRARCPLRRRTCPRRLRCACHCPSADGYTAEQRDAERTGQRTRCVRHPQRLGHQQRWAVHRLAAPDCRCG